MKTLTTAILLGFVGLMFISLLSVGHSADLKYGSVDCIFAAQHETYCPKGVMDHITAWKSIFMNMLPVAVVVLVVGSLGVLLATYPHLCRRWLLHTISIAPFFKQQRLTLYTFFYRPLQGLFARGILHPKLF